MLPKDRKRNVLTNRAYPPGKSLGSGGAALPDREHTHDSLQRQTRCDYRRGRTVLWPRATLVMHCSGKPTYLSEGASLLRKEFLQHMR